MSINALAGSGKFFLHPSSEPWMYLCPTSVFSGVSCVVRVLSEPFSFSNAMLAMDAVCPFVTVVCTTDGLYFQSRDVSHVMVMDTQLSDSVLCGYTCDTPITFVVSISLFLTALEYGSECHLTVADDAEVLMVAFPSPGMSHPVLYIALFLI